jgi:hypothetical protein
LKWFGSPAAVAAKFFARPVDIDDGLFCLPLLGFQGDEP